MGEIKRD